MQTDVNGGVCIVTRLRGTSWPASLVIVDAIALVLVFPHWAELARDVAAPHSWLERVGADRAAITLGTAALWLVALWLAIGLAALALTTAPGRVGRGAGQLARQLLPAVVMRAVAGTAGIGVLIAPVAAAADAASNGPGNAGAAATAQVLPSWPTDAGSLPAIRISWPTDRAARPASEQPPIPTPSLPMSPTPDPSVADHARAAIPAPDPSTLEADVLVRPGDSLWLIAAQRLGPDCSEAEIADAWPRWYAANERAIGPDPSVIQPGHVLHAPSDLTSTEEKTT
jgi:hypothetical protein